MSEAAAPSHVFFGLMRGAQQQGEVSFHAGPIKQDRPQDAEWDTCCAHRGFGCEF
jgi:hypothetical protein